MYKRVRLGGLTLTQFALLLTGENREGRDKSV